MEPITLFDILVKTAEERGSKLIFVKVPHWKVGSPGDLISISKIAGEPLGSIFLLDDRWFIANYHKFSGQKLLKLEDQNFFDEIEKTFHD